MFRKSIKFSLFIFALLAFFWMQPTQAASWINEIYTMPTTVPGTSVLRSIDMLDYKSGFIVGAYGTILKTTNGGASWTIVGGLPAELDVYDVDVIDQNTAWAVGHEGSTGFILKTTNGGATWEPQYVGGGSVAGFNSVFFFDASTGFAVGQGGLIVQTTDGGATWAKKTSGTIQNLYGVGGGVITSSVVTKVIWAVGGGGVILVNSQLMPSSSWNNWAAQTSPTTNSLKDVQVIAPSTSNLSVMAVGMAGAVLRTTNSGNTWTSVSAPVTKNWLSVSMTGTQGFIMSNTGDIIKTIDSGANWSSVSSPPTYQLPYYVSVQNSGSYPTAVAVSSQGNLIRYEEIPPTQPSSLQNTTLIGDNTPSFQWSAASDDYGDGFVGSGVGGYYLYKDGQLAAPVGNVTSYTFGLPAHSDGTHTFGISAYDKAGNTGAINTLFYTIDTAAPVVGAVTPTTATVGSAQTFFAAYSDAVGVTYCWLYVNDSLQGSMSLNNGSASKSYTFSSVGNYSVKVGCSDGNYNGWGAATTVTVTAAAAPDTTSPVVSAISPSTAVVNNAQSFTASYSDNVGVTSCGLFVNNVPQEGAMSLVGTTSGTATKSYTFSSAGSYAVKANCTDGTNTTWGAATTVTVTAAAGPDITAPDTTINSGPSLSTTSISATFGFSANEPAAFECRLDTGVFASCASPVNYNGLLVGSHTFQVRAKDAAGNIDASPASYTWTIISGTSVDTSAPYVSSITPTTAVATYVQSFTVSFSDSVGVTSCNLYVNSVDQGPMTVAGTTSGSASRIYTFSSAVSHTLQARCSDAAGNIGLGALTTVAVSAAPAVAADTIAPSTPTGAQKISNDADATPTFVWNAASDNVGTTNYLIQLDNGSLIDIGGSTSYTIPSNLSNGSHTFKVLAKDAAGNTSPTISYTFTVNVGSAVVSCPLTMEKAYKSSASKAVYYITTDCTKRPFKNGPSFFTYFDSWSEVITTTKTILDSIANDPLGFTPAGPKYDPQYGALVKIVTDPKVYLLLGTEKYWIISESVFNGLKYDWKWIEDVDPGLLNKYTVGSEITYTDHHPNYTIIKYASFANVYRLEPDPDDYSKQVKRWIKNEKVFKALKFRWDRIVTVPDSEVYKDGKVMDESEVNL